MSTLRSYFGWCNRNLPHNATDIMHWDYVIILICLGALVPWRSRAHVRKLLESPTLASTPRLNLYLSTIAFQSAVVALIVWRFAVHRGELSVFGFMFPHPLRAIVATICISVLLMLNQVLGVKRLSGLPIGKRGTVGRLAEALLPRNRRERWAALALVVTVALCEEFIYRGFVEYLFQSTLRSVALGAVISAIFFAVAHLYQGTRGLIATFVVGLILSATRIWTASLLTPIVIHFVVDFTAGVAALRFLKSQPAEEAAD